MGIKMSLVGWIQNLFGIHVSKVQVNEGKNEDNNGGDELSDKALEKAGHKEEPSDESNIKVFTVYKQKTESLFDIKALVKACQFIYETYGSKTFENTVLIKNMMDDLIPTLPKERKLFLILCKVGGINSLNSLRNKNEAAMQLWIEKHVNYFVNNEMIDKNVAYDFLCSLSMGILGSLWSDEKKDESREIVNQEGDKNNIERWDFEFEIEESEKELMLSDEKEDNDTVLLEEINIKETGSINDTDLNDGKDLTVKETPSKTASEISLNKTIDYPDRQILIEEEKRVQLIGRLVASIKTPLNELVNVLFAIVNESSVAEADDNKDLKVEKHRHNIIKQSLYYKETKSITDRYKTSNYEMLYQFWNTYYKDPDFQNYKEALFLILRERKIPFSEEAINEHFQILEGKFNNNSVSPKSKKDDLINTSISPNDIDRKRPIVKEENRKQISSISRQDAVIYPQKIINEMVERYIDSPYELLYVFWTIYKNSYRFDYYKDILFEILREKSISFSKEAVSEHFDFLSGKHTSDLTVKEKNGAPYPPTIVNNSSASVTSQYNQNIKRTSAYIPTGRVEFVSGHWRKRNGQWEYVHAHTRRK